MRNQFPLGAEAINVNPLIFALTKEQAQLPRPSDKNISRRRLNDYSVDVGFKPRASLGSHSTRRLIDGHRLCQDQYQRLISDPMQLAV
jgi:hypothetical protein